MAGGIVAGSAVWGMAAALGVSALMLTHVWAFTALRYTGALFLIFLAVKALRAAWHSSDTPPLAHLAEIRLYRLWAKGALIHLTNPKAMLAWGAVFAVAVPPTASAGLIWQTYAILITASCGVFFGYALLFSSARMTRAYTGARRWFEATFGILFGAAGLTLLFSRGQMQ